ncbi:MAG: anion permease [Opitutales bacterium]|nr:anion permease [Opitutales bacterium]
MQDAYLVYAILGLTLAAFIWGRFRYDLVSLTALFASVVLGLVAPEAAFAGFGHPAVITVAAVLVLSRGFQQSGLVDFLAGYALKAGGNVTMQVFVLGGTVAVLSAFMNNVGALALLMPVALRMAREHKVPASRLLMPLAFGSLLGGLMTLIGTPPNIIISTYRADKIGETYGMFSFFPVGAGVAAAGLVFLVLLGWRFTPERRGQASPEEMFDTADYLSELKVGEDSKAVGSTLRELREACGEPVPVLAVLRGKKRYPGHKFYGALKEGDALLIEADPELLKLVEEKGGLTVGGDEAESLKLAEADDLQIVEAVVRTDSRLVNRTVAQLRLLDLHGLHLMAVAREGGRLKQSLGKVRFRPGDVLLLQGDERDLSEKLPELGCLPLASRDLTLGKPRKLVLSVGIFAAAVASMVAGWLTAPVALGIAALATVMSGVLPVRDAYKGIDWPVIVLLAALIPVGEALEATGGAEMIAAAILELGKAWPPLFALLLLFVITTVLSNVVNNAAAALLMAPIAVLLADGFGHSLDPYLMTVAVAASCPFLTPIGHQSNTLVMGPGGYHFGDYWKVGLPMTAVVMAAAIPLILVVWPF